MKEVLLIPILILAIKSSYDQLKNKKTTNKTIIMCAILAIAIYVILLTTNTISGKELIETVLLASISLIIGYALWHYKIWSSSDAKIFAAYTLMIPQILPGLTTFQSASVIRILVNAAIPLAIIYSIKIIAQSENKSKIDAIKMFFNIKIISEYLLSIFGIGWVVNIIIGQTNLQSNILTYAILITVIYKILDKLWKEEKKYIIILLSILRVFFETNYILSLNFLTTYILSSLIFLLLIIAVSQLGNNLTKKKKVFRIKEGDVVVQAITKSGELTSRITSKNKEDYVFIPKKEGITEHDRKLIQSAINKKNNKITILEKIDFRIYLAIGALLTTQIAQNIITMLSYIFI